MTMASKFGRIALSCLVFVSIVLICAALSHAAAPQVQSSYIVKGNADRILDEKVHVVITLTFQSDPDHPVDYEEWADLSDWSKDPLLVIARMAKFKAAKLEKEAQDTVIPIQDSPKTLTKGQAEAKVSADEEAKSKAKAEADKAKVDLDAKAKEIL